MSFRLTSQVLASLSPAPATPTQDPQSIHGDQLTIPGEHQNPSDAPRQRNRVDYSGRAQWLRAAVLGANDGLVSVASLMMGVGAVSKTSRAMLVSGLAGLVAGACSMAIGEFVSVYAQYDIEVAQMKRDKENEEARICEEEKERLPSPLQAAGASALAFAIGALLPLLGGGFIRSWAMRIGVVCGVTSLGLAGFGAAGAVLGGASVRKSAVRVLIGGWVAMALSYGMLRLFSLAFGTEALAS